MKTSGWIWQDVPAGLEDKLLTLAQKEVFQLLRQGMTHYQIAAKRGTNHRNVTEMATRIRERLTAIGYDHKTSLALVPDTDESFEQRSASKKIRHMVIPDCQVKPGEPYDHLAWAGQYAVQMKPDVIVCIGDFWDMPSLSQYDIGRKSFEGKRYIVDIEAGIRAMESFLEPIKAETAKLQGRWNPRMVFTLGNHEQRIITAIDKDAKLEGLMSLHDMQIAQMGWEVYPFLEPVVIDGIAYCHYFSSGTMGRPVSSASALVNKKMMSCVMGHVQDKDIAYRRRADGKSITGIFAGIFYQHDENYLTPQTNRSWRGVWILHDVQDGAFDEMPVSLSYLQDRFGKREAAA